MSQTKEITIDLEYFDDYEVLEYVYNLIKNDRDKMDYFMDLMIAHIFNFDFLKSDLYTIEYKKDYFEAFPDHKKLIDFIKANY